MVIGMVITNLLIESCQLVVPISDQSCSAGGRGQRAVKQCYGLISSETLGYKVTANPFLRIQNCHPVMTNQITHGIL